ncbi:6213_t:CDS:2 [Ambispora gerdemannii]|uniref:Dynactin subunit 4 n=1 Tax=Ambispora gerdemannii TaxID=144530 RepID=A0A9N8V3E5_9GLOM|nr:6213_t:CDS:2 [Ambispora gerdemannii]
MSSHSSSNDKLRPFVHYHCACPDVYSSTESSLLSETVAACTHPTIDSPPSVNSLRIHHSTFPLSKLYICEDCHQIRCPRCIQEEIICYYCPNCLFEVPTASVKSERNRCARSCFQCPICQNTLSVIASVEPSSATSPTVPTAPTALTASTAQPPQPVAAQAGGAPYYLLCGVCRWDSQEIKMTFEKPTGLSLQLQTTDDERPDVKEFDHLKEHFEKHLRMNTPSTTLPTQLLSIPGMGTLSSRYGTNVAHSQQKSDDVNPYEAVVRVADDVKLAKDLSQLKDVNQITTFAQRTNQLSDQPYQVDKLQPQRIHLRTKRVKRCRSCRHILIKPEQKAQATKFKIKLVALNYIPKITIAKLPYLVIDQTVQIILKFSNPLLEDANVSLSCKEEIENFGKIKLLATNFTIGPYNELLEYDDEELSTEKLTSKSRPASRASIVKPDPGVVEKKGNYTCIAIEITPLFEVEEFKFPLLVTHTSKVLDIDVVDNNETQQHLSVPAADTTPVASAVNSVSIEDENNTENSKKLNSLTISRELGASYKSLSFWTIIGLGPVLKEPVPPRSSEKTPSSSTTPQSTEKTEKHSKSSSISSSTKPSPLNKVSSSAKSSSTKSSGSSVQPTKQIKKTTTVYKPQ